MPRIRIPRDDPYATLSLALGKVWLLVMLAGLTLALAY